MSAAEHTEGGPMEETGRFQTPGTLVIMTVYLGFFVVAWLLSFLYLGLRWAIS